MHELNPEEYGRVELSVKCMRGMVRAENTETSKGYQLASGEYTVDGGPQFPLWTVIDSGATPVRLSTLEVIQALVSTYDGNVNEQYTVVMTALSLMGELTTWASKYENNLKNVLLYTGSINLELAESLDIIEQFRKDLMA